MATKKPRSAVRSLPVLFALLLAFIAAPAGTTEPATPAAPATTAASSVALPDVSSVAVLDASSVALPDASSVAGFPAAGFQTASFPVASDSSDPAVAPIGATPATELAVSVVAAHGARVLTTQRTAGSASSRAPPATLA